MPSILPTRLSLTPRGGSSRFSALLLPIVLFLLSGCTWLSVPCVFLPSPSPGPSPQQQQHQVFSRWQACSAAGVVHSPQVAFAGVICPSFVALTDLRLALGCSPRCSLSCVSFRPLSFFRRQRAPARAGVSANLTDKVALTLWLS
jgi:hypothetical protein